jgi:hypothetical protein
LLRPDLPAISEKEIVDLHKFFVEWFTGQLENTDQAFSRVANALANEFHLISPRGVIDSQQEILDAIRGAHGARSKMEITIRNPELRWQSETHCLMTYEEWQQTEQGNNARLSSVLFEHASSHNALRWIHVHETWLPTQAG